MKKLKRIHRAATRLTPRLEQLSNKEIMNRLMLTRLEDRGDSSDIMVGNSGCTRTFEEREPFD